VDRVGDRPGLARTPTHRVSWPTTSAYLVGIAVAMEPLAAVDGTPAGIPAGDCMACCSPCWGQLVLWTTLAVVFERLADLLLDRIYSAGLLRRTERPTPGSGKQLCINKSGRMKIV
jgi:hypothetical protein